MHFSFTMRSAVSGAYLILLSGMLFFPAVMRGEDAGSFSVKDAPLGIEYFPEKYLSSYQLVPEDFPEGTAKDRKAFEALFRELEKNPASEILPHKVFNSGVKSDFFGKKSCERFIGLAISNPDALDLNLCAACLAGMLRLDGGTTSVLVANMSHALEKMPAEKMTMHHVRLTKSCLRLGAALDVASGDVQKGLKTFEQSEELFKEDDYPDKRSYLIDALCELRKRTSAMEGSIRPNVLLATQTAKNDALCRSFTDKCLAELENDRRGVASHVCECIGLLRAGRGEDLKRIVFLELAGNPEDTRLLRFAASVCGSMGEHANAARLMRQVVLSYGAGDCPIGDCLTFADCARKAKFFDMAESACRVAELLEGAEENSDAIDLSLGLTMYDKGDYRMAVAALKSFPDSRSKYFICACALYRMKEYAAAIGAAIKGVDCMGKGEKEVPYEVLGICADASDKLGDMTFIDKVGIPQCLMFQDNAAYLNTVGYICADRSHELDKAEQFIFKALAYQPHNEAFLDSAAWVKYRKKDYAAAKEYMEKCLKEYADDGETRIDAVILDHAGDVYFAAGDSEKAVTFWRKALKADGDIDNEKVLSKIEDVLKKH